MKRLLTICAALAVASRSLAQSQAASRPAFEVASVKPNKSEGMMELGGHNEKFHALRISLEGLIEYAYNINHNEIVGPAWLGSETYDIEAEPEHPVSIAQIRQNAAGAADGPFQTISSYGNEGAASLCIGGGKEWATTARGPG
jgi:hypothetical protein